MTQEATLEGRLEEARERHETVREQAEERLARVELPENDRGISAFVNFRTRAAAAAACQVFSLAPTP